MAITTRVHIMELDMLFWILICYAHIIHMYEIVDDVVWYKILYTSYEIDTISNNNYDIDFIQTWVASKIDSFGHLSN